MRTTSVLSKVRLLQSTLKAALLFFLLATLCSNCINAQVNAYARVTDIGSNNTQLTISNLNQTYHTFAAGEQVIVMQMQDNVIGPNTSNNSSFGTLSSIASAGLYEARTISAVTATSITLTEALQHSYGLGSNSRVQVVSFTKLGTTDYTTTSDITAIPWNGSTGGVVAIQVNGTLTVAHNITADGQGFRGGAASSNYENSCEPLVYISSSSNYAAKGEGIYRNTNNSYNTGRGRMLNGGGGGSDDNAGGAGGGSFTTGGQGGHGWTCSSSPAGGLGGIELKNHISATRFFMGGGGGGGQQNNGYGTAGGNGGGIVIIKANMIRSACAGSVGISANGASGADTGGGGNDAAGGGGAGGTVIIQSYGFDIPGGCTLNVEANGGNGGNVNHTGAHGGGGGGAQGAVIYALSMPLGNIVTSTANGVGGLNNIGGTRAENATGISNEGILVTLNLVLPAKSVSLRVEKAGLSALLRWANGNDADTRYEIEHSTNDTGYSIMKTMRGTSSITSDTRVYNIYHEYPRPGKNYYRLRMTDIVRGEISYSRVATLDFRPVPTNRLEVFPNPVREKFNIRISTDFREQVVITVRDMQGNIIVTVVPKMPGSLAEGRLPAGTKPGIYFVELVDRRHKATGKIVVH